MPMKSRYTVVDGEVIAQKRNGVRTELVPDPLGSTVAIVDSAQAVTDTASYYPYGEVASRTGSTVTPFQFVGTLGYYQDAPTRSYVRARYLDSYTGRWITQDPIGHWGGPNLYRYCRNSPMRFMDSTGLQSVGAFPGATDPSQPMKLKYDAKACQNEMALWRNELYGVIRNHAGKGKFDYKNLLPYSLWRVHDTWLNSGEFGNYAAGYAAYYNGGPLGLFGVQILGHVFEALETNIRKDQYEVAFWGDDGEIDKNMIMLGAIDAYEDEVRANATVPYNSYQWQSHAGQVQKSCLDYLHDYNYRNFGSSDAVMDPEPQQSGGIKGRIRHLLGLQ